jgi:hypothetical protein
VGKVVGEVVDAAVITSMMGSGGFRVGRICKLLSSDGGDEEAGEDTTGSVEKKPTDDTDGKLFKLVDMVFAKSVEDCVKYSVITIFENDRFGDVAQRIQEIVDNDVSIYDVKDIIRSTHLTPGTYICVSTKVVFFVSFVFVVDCGIGFVTFGVQFRILFLLFGCVD